MERNKPKRKWKKVGDRRREGGKRVKIKSKQKPDFESKKGVKRPGNWSVEVEGGCRGEWKDRDEAGKLSNSNLMFTLLPASNRMICLVYQKHNDISRLTEAGSQHLRERRDQTRFWHSWFHHCCRLSFPLESSGSLQKLCNPEWHLELS